MLRRQDRKAPLAMGWRSTRRARSTRRSRAFVAGALAAVVAGVLAGASAGAGEEGVSAAIDESAAFDYTSAMHATSEQIGWFVQQGVLVRPGNGYWRVREPIELTGTGPMMVFGNGAPRVALPGEVVERGLVLTMQSEGEFGAFSAIVVGDYLLVEDPEGDITGENCCDVTCASGFWACCKVVSGTPRCGCLPEDGDFSGCQAGGPGASGCALCVSEDDDSMPGGDDDHDPEDLSPGDTPVAP